MANRGFIKDIGGAKRMRFVRPGYDANDMGVPPNQVIFDSENIGALSVYTSGVVDVQTPIDGYIASWSDLGFTPLAMVQFMGHPSSPRATTNIGLSTTEWRFTFRGQSGGVSAPLGAPNNEGPKVFVYSNGLRMRLHTNSGTDEYRLFVRYIVYRAAL
ncbi:hypothetical protein [Aliihoeflea sp. 40Bstr573]|uniref:hypothetical protein n=1 Tax=Aliihoeflea sp. 40Bstr573 TaxID=2696467 RepID=UPI00209652FC|nr:hypothetical protein [Aliihoeflea sp. 40Bstr573]MCO6386246.1 hypothetical protein [Aliihoeflea sp. 40Bstr573]